MVKPPTNDIVFNDGHHGFFQPLPRPAGPGWDEDPFLQSYLDRHVKSVVQPAVWREIQHTMVEAGALSNGPLHDSLVADVPNEPSLTQWTANGRRVDRVTTTFQWDLAKRVTAHYGLIRAGYDVRKYGTARRIVQHSLGYLFSPSLDMYTCPLAMTDGAAATLLASQHKALIARAVPHLIARDVAAAWTSGQWFTERTGGSDLRFTRTFALPAAAVEEVGGGVAAAGCGEGEGAQPAAGAVRPTHYIHGTKWFSSAAASEMAIVTARPAVKGGGGRGGGDVGVGMGHGAVSGWQYDGGVRLFFVETRGAQSPLEGRSSSLGMSAVSSVGSSIAQDACAYAAAATPPPLLGVEVNRLKYKLGTKKVPTGELTLRGAPAVEIGGDGVGGAQMLVVTRLWNTVGAAAYGRRAVSLMRGFAQTREVFGAKLSEQPAYQRNVAALDATTTAMTILGLHTAAHCGVAGEGPVDGLLLTPYGEYEGVCAMGSGAQRVSSSSAKESAGVLRLLLPVAKLTTGKQVVAAMSEAIEGFGGAGYVHDTGLPQLLTDAQVLPIWEGTTDTLSGTVLRAVVGGALPAALRDIERLLASVPTDGNLGRVKRACESALGTVTTLAKRLTTGDGKSLARDAHLFARDFGMTLGRTWQAALLAEHAAFGAIQAKGGGGGGMSGVAAGYAASAAAALWLTMEGLVVSSPAVQEGGDALIKPLARL